MAQLHQDQTNVWVDKVRGEWHWPQVRLRLFKATFFALSVVTGSAIAAFWAWYHFLPDVDQCPLYGTGNISDPPGSTWLSRLDFWIVDTGNAWRTRDAIKVGRLDAHDHMSDEEFGSRVLHSACLEWGNCLPFERYSMEVLCLSESKQRTQVTFRTTRMPGIPRQSEPSSRFLGCYIRNPDYFFCIDANDRQDQFRFVATGPYVPIELKPVDSLVLGCPPRTGEPASGDQ